MENHTGSKCMTWHDIVHENKTDLEPLVDFLPGILKTTTMGYDGKGQYPIKNMEQISSLNIDFSNEYILEKRIFVKNLHQMFVLKIENKLLFCFK